MRGVHLIVDSWLFVAFVWGVVKVAAPLFFFLFVSENLESLKKISIFAPIYLYKFKRIIYRTGMSEFELKFELRNVPIGELVENVGQIPNVPKNPRKITKERMAALIKSIKESPEMEKLN